ncbi:expressed unknown protein [Seminavis robusta]|uniref:EF-hand domain-containing protein n=1 Tax=Seminavis robusta TaxID=568900 RepID=A0A9N8DGI5_9STRA|nr:expressed unknown protein [Seminavis robusta]|eukprot:Sro56_g033060.1 n/a (1071) ;mRNA; f:139519-143017
MMISPMWHRLILGTLVLAPLLMNGSYAQTGDLEICLDAIEEADTSGNNRMSKEEYVVFLNNITSGDFGFTTYENLPEALLMNFEIYEQTGGVIDIRGATLRANANKRQKRVVETLCETTDMAIAVLPTYVSVNRNSDLDSNSTASIESNTTRLSLNGTDHLEFIGTNQTALALQNETLSTPNVTASGGYNNTNITETTSTSSTSNTTPPLSENDQVATNYSSQPNATDAALQQDPTHGPTVANATIAPSAIASAPLGEPESSLPPTSSPSSAPTVATTRPSVPTQSPSLSTPGPSVLPTAPSTLETSSVRDINATAGTNDTNDTGTDLSTSSPTNAPTNSTSEPEPTIAPIDVMSADNVTNATEADNGSQSVSSETLQAPTMAPSLDPQSGCKMVMSFADIDEDDAMNEMEYVWFLNDNWDNPYPGAVFQDLPQGLKDNFNNFASEGQIDISMLNSENPMSNDQEAFLDRVCAETEIVLSAEPVSDTDGDEASMATFKECLESLTLHDENGDSWLEFDEYVALIKVLSGGDFGQDNFEALPDELQDNFYALAISSRIDLGGAKHGADLSAPQKEVLDTICIETSYALEEANKNAGEGDTFDTVDTNTMLEYAACFMGMNDVDQNDDFALDQSEYIDLINLMGKYRFQNYNFTQLPLLLQDNFWNLQTDGSIDIEGSQEGQSPDSAQQHHLGEVCLETTAAVNMAIAMAIEYTGSDTSMTTASPSDLTPQGEPIVIHSSFNIYSDVWIAGEEFIMGMTRDSLQEAYRQFVMEAIDGLRQQGRQRQYFGGRSLQETVRRPLAVLDRESPSIDNIVDLNCAGASEGAICKTVFASYKISPMDGDMDRQGLYAEYVRVTQSFIDGGLLQITLERVNPETMITRTMTTTSEWRPTEKDYCFPSQLWSRTLGSNIASIGKGSSDHSQQRKEGFISLSQNSKRVKEIFRIRSSRIPQQYAYLREVRRLGGDLGTESDEDGMHDEELGKMQVIDLAPCNGVNAATNDFEAISQAHMRNLVKRQQQQHSRDGVPPLRRKKNDDMGSQASEDLSFAFRRYAIDGEDKRKPDEPQERYGDF